VSNGSDTKNPEGTNEGTETNQDKPEQNKTEPKKQETNIDDLKAKLGLTSKPPKKTTKPKPAEPKLKQQQPAQNAHEFQHDDLPLDEEALQSIRGGSMRWPIVVTIIGVFALLIGILFGKIMRDRKIDNRRTEEAKFILHYLERSRGSKLNSEEGTILTVVQSFNKKVHEITKALINAKTPQKKQAVQNSLKAFLKKTQEFIKKSAYFSIESALPNVIYNQKIAFKVVQFINDVHEFNRLAALLGTEAATLNRIVGPDPTKKQYQYIEMETLEENGLSLHKGIWLEAVDWKNVKKQKGTNIIPVKPFGKKEGYYLPIDNLIKLDITPIVQQKASLYKRLIFARVIKGLMQLKLQGDKLDFPSLKKDLRHYANREMLFTIF